MVIIESLADPRVVSLLRAGKVGVLPTDTIYGIVVLASDTEAVARLYKAKHRERKPGTLISPDIEHLSELGIDGRYLEMVSNLWPNPISVVLPTDELHSYLHLGKNSLAVRVPGDEQVQELLEQTGILLTSSANQPGKAPAETVEQAYEYFGEDVDFYVRGDTSGNKPSTVLRLTADGQLEILRQGAISIDIKGE